MFRQFKTSQQTRLLQKTSRQTRQPQKTSRQPQQPQKNISATSADSAA